MYETTGNITCGEQNNKPFAETRYVTIAQYEFDTNQFPKVIELFTHDKQSIAKSPQHITKNKQYYNSK